MSSDINEFQSNGHIKSSPLHDSTGRDGNLSGSSAVSHKFSTSTLYVPADSSPPGTSTEIPNATPTKKCTYPPSCASKVEELRPEEIRWMYRESGTKKWIPFIGYDSLRIECKYREMRHSLSRKILCVDSICDELINVRGGLYEVDVMKMKCLPIYWSSGQVMDVIRGRWFVDGTWQPLDEEYAEFIETEHLNKFGTAVVVDQECGEMKAESDKVVHHISFNTCHIKWITEDSVYFYNQKSYSKFYNAISRTLKLTKRGIRIRRGYLDEARMTDKPPDITHLVFVVHGVGQRMYEGSILKTCSDFRDSCQKMLKHFPDFELDNKRLEFLPTEWRSSLTLDGDTVESITPNKVRDVRTFLNGSAMDVMYYTSPLYRSEIASCLQTELNRLYEMFLTRQPYFEASGGKVSIAAHSLGAVIVHDIVTGWNPSHLYDMPSVISEAPIENDSDIEHAKQLRTELKLAKQRVRALELELQNMTVSNTTSNLTLKFKVDCFFTLGSPLALFLALRGLRPGNNTLQNQIISKHLCQRLYNIFHPSDPVAYRLEPLLLRQYSAVKPIRIHRHNASTKEPYESMAVQAYVSLPSTQTSSSVRNSEELAIASATATDEDDDEDEYDGDDMAMVTQGKCRYGEGSDLKMIADRERLQQCQENVMATSEDASLSESDTNSSSADAKFFPKLEHRLDYMLRTGKMESSYLSTLTSHTAYWTNLDVALFMLSQMFPEYSQKQKP